MTSDTLVFPVYDLGSTDVLHVVADLPWKPAHVPDGAALAARIRLRGWFDPGVREALRGW
jgi:hypothetical protein